jgi:hypothetical protein
MHHFLAMGYDMSKFSTPSGTRQWLTEWAATQFGEDVAKTTADIMSIYGKLTARRKYEDLSITPFAFSTSDYDEAEANFQEWLDLLDLAKTTYTSLPTAVQVAFFQMILHPIQAGKQVFEIYTKAALGQRYASERRQTTNDLSQQARDAFAADQALTKQFHTMVNGKWNHMMDQTHIGYNNWQEPGSNSMPALSSLSATASGGKPFGVGIQGSGTMTPDAARITVLPVTQYMPPAETRWLDVFLRQKSTVSYTVKSNVSYVGVSSPNGTIGGTGPSQLRSAIGIDWTSAPIGNSAAELTLTAGGQSTVVVVPLKRVDLPEDFEGHIESNGVVSIEANHFLGIEANKSTASYVIIPDYGRTQAGVKLWPVTTPVQEPSTGPSLVYRFFSSSTASAAKVTIYLSSSENADSERPNRYAVSIDGKAPITVQPTPIAADAGQEPAGWDDAVTRNAWIRDSNLGSLSVGTHELRIWLLNPTMVLTKIVVDIGGVKRSELGPPESFRVCKWRKRDGAVESANCKLE